MGRRQEQRHETSDVWRHVTVKFLTDLSRLCSSGLDHGRGGIGRSFGGNGSALVVVQHDIIVLVMNAGEGVLGASPPPARSSSEVSGSEAHKMLGRLGSTEAAAQAQVQSPLSAAGGTHESEAHTRRQSQPDRRNRKPRRLKNCLGIIWLCESTKENNCGVNVSEFRDQKIKKGSKRRKLGGQT